MERAFLQIGIQEAEHDAIWFLWLKHLDKPVENDNVRKCIISVGYHLG